MAKVKLDFKRLPVPDKIHKARRIVANLTGNSAFPSPNPSLTQITTAINALEAALMESQIARQNSHMKTAAQNEKEDLLDQQMTQVAAYIESSSGGDEAAILAAGVGIRAASASHIVTKPTDFSLTQGDHDAELEAQWNRVSGARSYVLERSLDPPTDSSWVHEKVVTTSSATIGGLTSGVRYWFRVAAVGARGQSGWSDPATKIAP